MQETARKLIHLVFGLAIAAMVLVLDRTLAIQVLVLGLFTGIILVELILKGWRVPLFSRLVAALDRSDPLPGRGAFYFAVSALACVTLFPAEIAVPALVTVAVLDSVTTLAGRRFGRTRIYNGKSFEGTIAGIAVTAIALLPFLSVPGSLVVAAIAGIIELLSPVDDNLVVPVSTCILLSLFPSLL
jgi:dolichol kinase